MGTHLPEIFHCMEQLAGVDADRSQAKFWIPVGLDQPFKASLGDQTETFAPTDETWHWLEASPERAFILLDPRLSPVPQLESLAARLREMGIEPLKVCTCVDSRAAEDSAQLRSYYEACIYYSDIVLLGNRSQAGKSFLRSYQKEFERHCYPCLFLLLKGKGVPNAPLEILTPGVRRISQLFDIVINEEVTELDPLIEASCDLDLEEMEDDPWRIGDDAPAPKASVPDINDHIVFPVS